MYKKATKEKIRFDTVNGMLMTEDLYDLPSTSEKKASLNSVYKDLRRQMKANEESSPFDSPSKENKLLSLKFDIIKDVIKDRIEERDAAKIAASNKVEKEQLNALIFEKEKEALKGKSIEELKKRRDAL